MQPASSKAQGREAGGSAPDPSLADAVELRNGGYLRGMIVEFDPASHLSLRLPNGTTQHIAIADIASAERAGHPLTLGPGTSASTSPGAASAQTRSLPAPAAASPNAASPNAASPNAASPSAASPNAATPTSTGSTATSPKPGETDLDRVLAAVPGPRIRLNALGDQRAYLQRLIGDAGDTTVAYHLVCKIPCEVDLPANDPSQYRIADIRLEPTRWFKLPNYNATARAHIVSDMWPLWPRAMLVGGVSFGILGGTFVGIHALGENRGLRDTGLVLAGVSGAFFLASGLLWLFRPESSVSIERTQ